MKGNLYIVYSFLIMDMEKNKFIKNFKIVSFAIGGIFFLMIGIQGFIKIAGIVGTPSIGLLLFTVLISSFGIWSIRSFMREFRFLS